MSDRTADKVPTKGRTLFRWLGVPWTVDADSWQFLISRLTVSLIVALLFSPATNFGLQIIHGVAYAALLMLAQFLHITGHTLGGKAVGAPMDENRIKRDFVQTLYHGMPQDLPRRVEVIRTVAGPLANITVGSIAAIATLAIGGHALRFFAAVNLILALIVLMPIRTLDGGVLWRMSDRD